MPVISTTNQDNPSWENKGVLALAFFFIQSAFFISSLKCFFSGSLLGICFGFVTGLAAATIFLTTITNVTSQLQSDNAILQIWSSELPWWANVVYIVLSVVLCVFLLEEELQLQESKSERHASVLHSMRGSSYQSFRLKSKSSSYDAAF